MTCVCVGCHQLTLFVACKTRSRSRSNNTNKIRGNINRKLAVERRQCQLAFVSCSIRFRIHMINEMKLRFTNFSLVCRLDCKFATKLNVCSFPPFGLSGFEAWAPTFRCRETKYDTVITSATRWIIDHLVVSLSGSPICMLAWERLLPRRCAPTLNIHLWQHSTSGRWRPCCAAAGNRSEIEKKTLPTFNFE